MDETKIPKTVWKKTFTPMDDISSNNKVIDTSDNIIQNPYLFPEPQRNKTTKNEPIPANLQENPLKSIYETDEQNVESTFHSYKEYFNTMREGLETFREGFDTSICRSVGQSLRPIIDYILSWIIWIFAWFDVIETNVGKHMSNFFSNGQSSDSDKEIIKLHFQYFISVCFSCYIVYNWFYVAFFKRGEVDEEGKDKVEGKRMEITEISVELLETKYFLLSLILKYLIVPISILDYISMKIIPKMMETVLHDRKLIFIILYVSIILIVINYGNYFKDMLLNGINMKSDSNSGYFTMSMMGRGFYDGLTTLISPPDLSALATKNANAGDFAQIKLLAMYAIKKYTLILQFFSFLFRLVVSMSAVWFCSLTVAVFMYFKSFLCMFFDKDVRNAPGDVMTDIDFFILSQRKKQKCYPCGDPNKFGPCHPLSFKMILHYIKEFIEKVYVTSYRYVFEISFIILFLKSILNYKSDIQNVKLKSALIIMCSVFIFLCLFIGFQRSISIAEEANLAKKATEILIKIAKESGKPSIVMPVNGCDDDPPITVRPTTTTMFEALAGELPKIPVTTPFSDDTPFGASVSTPKSGLLSDTGLVKLVDALTSPTKILEPIITNTNKIAQK